MRYLRYRPAEGLERSPTVPTMFVSENQLWHCPLVRQVRYSDHRSRGRRLSGRSSTPEGC